MPRKTWLWWIRYKSKACKRAVKLQGQMKARDGSSTALLWQYGVCNDKPIPALLRESYNSGVGTALSSAHQLIQGSSQGECPKWVANSSGAEPDEGVTDKQTWSGEGQG